MSFVGNLPPVKSASSALWTPVWELYNKEAAEFDEALVDRLRSNIDSLLVFVSSVHSIFPYSIPTALQAGLFSGVVSSFLLESYSALSPDPSDTTNFYLAMISQQISSPNNQNVTALLAVPPSFTPDRSSIRVNILWTLSLVLSIFAALAATLVQSWLSRYTRLVSPPLKPYKTAAQRAFYFDGAMRYKFPALADALPATLHVSLFLFLAGMVEYVIPMNEDVARATEVAVALCVALYLASTVLSLVSSKSPYKTPIASILLTTFRACGRVLFNQWIRILRLVQKIVNNYRLSDDLSWDMLQHQLRCEAQLKTIHLLGRRVTVTPVSIINSLRWFVSRLFTDEDHNNFMKALLPILNESRADSGKEDGDHSNQWLRMFLSGEKPLIPLEHLRRYLPSLFNASIPSASKSPCSTSELADHEERLEICHRVLLKCIQDDTVLAADVNIIASLREHISRTTDSHSTSMAHAHATISLLTVLSDALNRGVRYRAYGRVGVRIPRDWSMDDFLSWLDTRGMKTPVVLDIAVARALPPAENSAAMTRLHSRVSMHAILREDLDEIVVTPDPHLIAASTNSISISEHAFLEWLCIHTLNKLMAFVKRYPDPVRKSPVLKDMITTASYCILFADRRGEAFDVEVQRTFVNHIEEIREHLNTQAHSITPPLGSTREAAGSPFTLDAIRHFCKISCSLPDYGCRSRGERLLPYFESSRVVSCRSISVAETKPLADSLYTGTSSHCPEICLSPFLSFLSSLPQPCS